MSYREYFFATIGRVNGSPAPDWKQVLESLPGKGFGTNPKPGEVQPPNAPHHGITVMIDAGGNARGRVWLPTDVPTIDDHGNAWFTHEVQVIADGAVPGTLVWAWDSKGGAVPRPFEGQPVPPTEPPTQPHPADLEPRVAQNEADIADLKAIVQQQKDWLERLDAKVGLASKKGDPVQVTGKTGWAPATYTWTGKIL